MAIVIKRWNRRIVLANQRSASSFFRKLFNYSIDAGFRPGSRGPFVSAKGLKAIDAPFGKIGGEDRRPVECGPTRYAQTRPAS